MLKYIVFCFVVCSAFALKESDKCPKSSEEPGLLEKLCESKKFELKKELTCVCKWFLFRNKAGECVSSTECDKVTEAPTIKPEPTKPEPTKPEPTKPSSSCPEGYKLYVVPCKRHYGYGDHGGYGDKKCTVCKKPDYGQYPYGKYPYGKYPYGKYPYGK